MGQGWRCITEDWRSTRQDWRCNRKAQTCPPCGACRRTFFHILAYGQIYKLLQRSTYAQLDCVRTYVRGYVRACVHTSRWKILFTPYLVIELSPSAEIWCAYVTSTNDGTQILTFLGIHNNRDFQNSRFFGGDSIIFKS